ncbi:MAG TPA: tRNA (adenosine(37)-N6)-threonylcarbamoyltransferase complex dimerization subunit type 1 TsaB [Candidatus Binatia bacterium]|nr:tRNA (adenosine(37)-N6)-threonylcarbamoyltransferase complex dimerization subunit type 1 TsaB [Candidatus Binatia bacterium]
MTTGRYMLGIDTSSRIGSIALAVDGEAGPSLPLPPGGHSNGLSQAGESLLRARSIGWKDLAGVAVSEGPGSFTGLRIGLAWAKGICFGSRARLTLVSAHAANAHRHRGDGAWIATVLQGERGEAQATLWSGGEDLARVWGPESVPEVELAAALRSAAAARAIAIAGPDLKEGLLQALREDGFRILADAARSTAAAVAELGDRMLLAGEAADLVTSAPAYGRAPNARKPAP